mgnify:CR=1 FL=1
MNQRELNELRRRFRMDRNSISRVFGCYVNSTKEVISWVDASLGPMQQEEQEMYLSLLKKSLSGTLGKNLLDIEFSTRQVAEGEEHKLLQALRQSELQDQEARERLCRTIIDAMDMGESNYLILLAADNYDVPYHSKDGEDQDDASDEVFRYFVCSVCPVKSPTLELRYDTDENEFHSSSTGHVAASPEIGFLFPAFDNRSANIYNALYYCKNPDMMHQEVIDAVFRVEPPLSAVEQKNIFDTALGDALEQDCSFDMVQSVHEQLRTRIEEHKESRNPEKLELSVEEVGGMLRSCGASLEQVKTFQTKCTAEYGEGAGLTPGNLIESRKFEITTPEVKISVSPENSYLIEARVLNGRKYLLIPADDVVEVNGIGITIGEDK